jgi:hypothetical protein
MTVTIEHETAGGAPAPSGRTIRWRGQSIPVIGPNRRDPRLHLALIIVAVLAIGTGLLDFRLSIPHIVVTVAVCGLTEAGYRLATTGVLMWPASAMQTATSTVLVLRVVGVEHGDWWSVDGLHWFVGVAVLGLLTKYVVRTAQGHIFNPSNIALVVAFLTLGAKRIEPLDFWWGHFGWSLALMYAVIIVGGITLCRRLGLLAMAVAFWLTLAAGVALLAALGHSITTRWSFAPVDGWHLWRTIVLSPETLIFLFFMITDPKTTPKGRVARAMFGCSVGVLSTLLIAPWPTEYGAKVGLLSGLAVLSVLRPVLERRLPAAGAEHDRLPVAVRHVGTRPVAAAVAAAVVALTATGVVVAGVPNREHDTLEADRSVVVAAERQVAGEFDRTDAPPPALVIRPAVAGLSQDLATQGGARGLIEALYFNLDVEAEAIATGDAGLLVAVDHGQRLIDMTARAGTRGEPRTVVHYVFDAVELDVAFPGGFQSGPHAAVAVVGTATHTVLGADGAIVDEHKFPVEVTFTMRQTPTGEWLTTGTL